MKIKDKKIVYYEDELKDEFSGKKITPRIIDENYKFIHKNIFWNMSSYLWQNILTLPIKWLYARCKFNIKYIGKEKLKEYKDTSYFVYVNHTQIFGDTFIPSIPMFPKRNYFIVNPENVSMKFIGNFVQKLGAIPIPNKISGMEKFLDAIKDKIDKNYAITIYPEAHIWPFNTDIRNFSNVSFKYPIEFEKPVFCITNTYKSYGRKNNKVRIVSYIDGPFLPNKELSKKAQKNALRDEVYNCMKERAKNSNVKLVEYIKK